MLAHQPALLGRRGVHGDGRLDFCLLPGTDYEEDARRAAGKEIQKETGEEGNSLRIR